MTLSATSWHPLGPTIEVALEQRDDPMFALAQGRIPAVVLRRQYEPADCRQLVERFYEWDLVPGLPKPGDTIEGRGEIERVDVGTSLGNLGGDPEKFFASAERTWQLYGRLFEGLPDPVDRLYRCIERLAPGKRATTACEPAGRRYGPAIFRCHMPHWGYAPHIDSVRKREKRTAYAVHRFEHQLAGILLLQAPEEACRDCDSILYDTDWDEDRQKRENIASAERESIDPQGFYGYADREGIARCRIILNPGDVYFFNTERVHEVPAFGGHRPRIVMATFFGYSREEPDVFVWS